METLVGVGDNITLNAQLSDGSLSMPVAIKAILKDPDANVITEVNLAHFGDGLFLNNNITMPELDFITAQYFAVKNNEVDYTYTAGLNVFRNSEKIGLGDGSVGGRSVEEIVAHLGDDEQELIVEVSNDSD